MQKISLVFTCTALGNPCSGRAHSSLTLAQHWRLLIHCENAVSVPFLLQFEGGVVVISHDSQLLSRVCDDAERSEVWLVEDGEVERYDGYFEEYKAELVKEIADEMDED